ncbi:MAG: GntR family transcriptional regulator [Spirochaetota bacterium]
MDAIQKELSKVLERTMYGRFMNAESLALDAIRQAIISGALPPGHQIDEEFIAEKLHVSRMPIRQALGILDSEGLVEREYRRGVRVTKLSSDEIKEIYSIRAVLERLAIREAVAKVTDKQIGKIGEFLEKLNKSSVGNESFVELNTQFHSMLYEPSEWYRLLSTIETLRNQVSRYTALSHHYIQKLHLIRADHPNIFEAYKNRDADSAEQLINEHILRSMDILLETFEQSGDEAS